MPTNARTLLCLHFQELNGRPRRFRADRQPALAMKAMELVDLRSRSEEAIDRAAEDLGDGLHPEALWRVR